jgi:hypothetical protein
VDVNSIQWDLSRYFEFLLKSFLNMLTGRSEMPDEHWRLIFYIDSSSRTILDFFVSELIVFGKDFCFDISSNHM